MDSLKRMTEAAAYISTLVKINPKIAIVMGSGLGINFADELIESVEIPYTNIPYFPVVSTQGHQGKLLIGMLNGVPIAVLQGRYHYFEGIALTDVVFPIRALKAIGVKTIILTNSCGAVNKEYLPGDFMLITDHLNLVGTNPLIGHNDDHIGPRFPDASAIYSSDLHVIARQCAKKCNIILREGVYAWWCGPTYETPAEIRMIRMLGADAVGMSTVPEALAASHMGMNVLGISCLTNMATGIKSQKLSHQEVLDVAQKSQNQFNLLIKTIVAKIDK
ncbi:MAG: purine-nucleoside phosphorylase [Candidatus Izemoplasmatales bacterium]|jgi:purine-nucleoside phosphorylase